jgi:7-cyano-7-deazaguanine synthase
MTKALMLFSGGKDSTVALTWALSHHDDVVALSYDVPYRPRREAEAASAIARLLAVRLESVSLPFMRDVATITCSTQPRQTTAAYVPVRNLVFHAIACHLAQQWSMDVVIAGHIKSDSNAYSDASSEYLNNIYDLAAQGSDDNYLSEAPRSSSGAVQLILPLAGLDDGQVMELGRSLAAPVRLSWSCLEDGQVPCGRCVSCRDRHAALLLPGPE